MGFLLVHSLVISLEFLDSGITVNCNINLLGFWHRSQVKPLVSSEKSMTFTYLQCIHVNLTGMSHILPPICSTITSRCFTLSPIRVRLDWRVRYWRNMNNATYAPSMATCAGMEGTNHTNMAPMARNILPASIVYLFIKLG